ncbi:uncharacterized protein MONBRDRAFT_21994 [Monosiga brevicollis MX1]|uniref:Methyltransferase domain-containing protein n=1 Tax=Monosiga brevicollis TaxID=81824 RepID=A9UP81_MONBE|nr:uncharacterized protein MONBRDRAFT_21994 [Monosiga brevicollis MX1]EDQ92374.1 predicted protein [Monosiga brevicollis MX1]|eukprot:XP_001742136.1 hypothetical protein [Monosiga brevicollis MX1]
MAVVLNAAANLASLKPRNHEAANQVAIEQYSDASAKGYKKSKLAAWRLYGERHLAQNMLGNLVGCRVLDLACGEGFYTRFLKSNMGVASVIGVDLAPDMIKLARQEEQERPLDIEYICADAADLNLDQLGHIDMCFAAYLLNYAPDYDTLLTMCKMIFRLLPPGGRFATINNNPNDVQAHHPEMRKYCFTKTCADRVRVGGTAPLAPGAVIKYRFFATSATCEAMCEIDNYFLPTTLYQQALAEAGFENIQFHPYVVSSEGQKRMPAGYWDDILATQPVIGLSANRPK